MGLARAQAIAPQPPAAAPPEPPVTSQPAPQQPQETQQSAPKSEAGSITQIIGEALEGVSLKPEQKEALAQLGDQVDDKVGDVDEAKRELLLALAAQIEQGNVDAMALHPQMEKFMNAVAGAAPVVRRSLEKLHDTLYPEQRKQFVTNLRNVLEKRESEHAGKSQLDAMAKTLNLSDEQKQKISAILEAHKDKAKVAKDVAKARVELILASFPGEEFALDDLVPAGAVQKRAEKMLEHIIETADEITPILTEQQRAAAAKALRDRFSEKAEEHPDHVSQSLVAARGGVAVRGGGWAARGYRAGVGYGGGYGAMWMI